MIYRTFYSAKSSKVSVRVRSSYIFTDGNVLEIDSIVVHEKFDKYVYFNDIALMKVRISLFAEQTSRAYVFYWSIACARMQSCHIYQTFS